MSNSITNPIWSPPTLGELQNLEGEQLVQWELAPGDLYLKTNSGKILRLKRAGDFLELPWREKFKASKNLLWKPFVQTDKVSDLVKSFQHWQQAQDPVDYELAKNQFMENLRLGLRPDGGLKMIDWSFACRELFKSDSQLVEEFQNKHVVLYRRGLLVSSLAVLLSLASGYHDPRFLKEIYHVSWWLDAGLIHDDFSYWVSLACQEERWRPGGGDALLKENGASEKEVNLFLEHPRFGYEKAIESLGKKLEYPELLMSILRHHEKSDGTGFPEGMSLSVMSDWETLMMMADNMVDYREEVLEDHLHNGILTLWKAFQARPIEGLPVHRIVEKFRFWLRHPHVEVLSA
ncbi:MAG: hypothetical protein K2P81_01990 [Bacteriovoracaceae bacterium]|nr:hypothetical protein [Bacteriovoracaceae bacterium]